MQIMTLPAAAWACAAAGLAIHAAACFRSLKPSAAKCWMMLLPAALALICAKGGFLLLQEDAEYAQFRWCFSAGLIGLALGTVLAARLLRAGAPETLDKTAAAACLAMAMARLSQRWLGETGIGPILDVPGFYTVINEWEEPLLATWMIETAICVLALCAVPLYRRGGKRAPGSSACIAAGCLMIPQILAEQFRSGEYLRYRMMRLEQLLFALIALAALVWLCLRFRKMTEKRGAAGWGPVLFFLAMAGVIAAAQYMLDGKLLEAPAWLCWTLYALAVAGMLGAEFYAARRLNRAAERKGTEG